MIRDQRLVAISMLLLAVAFVGCANSSSADNQQKQGDKMRALLSLYVSAGRAMGHTPNNKVEFEKYIQEQGGQFLERLNIQSVDELFISSRDGKPYVIVYGKRPSGIVLYEAEGIDGSRMVGYDIGQIGELSAEQFAELGL